MLCPKIREIILLGLCSAAPCSYAQQHCKPLLPLNMVADLPCAANLVGGNTPGGMYPPEAIEQARRVLWDRFWQGTPGFLNLDLASKEGAETRIVYILERPADGSVPHIRWASQRQAIDFVHHKARWHHTARWEPVESFEATTMTRDQTTGRLTFRNGAEVVGEL